MWVPSLLTGESWAVRLETMPLLSAQRPRRRRLVLFLRFGIQDAQRPRPEQGGKGKHGTGSREEDVLIAMATFQPFLRSPLAAGIPGLRTRSSPVGRRAGQVSLAV